MAALVALEGPQKGREFPLKDAAILGRSSECEVCINDPTVSRHHAQITRTARGWVIQDMGSSNGTILDEKKINAPTPLRDQALITAGQNVLRFSTGERTSTSAKTRPVAVIQHPREDTSRIVNRLDVRSSSAKVAVAAPPTDVRLQTVMAVSRAVHTEFDLDKLLNQVMSELFKVFPQTERGFVLLRDEESGELVPAVNRRRDGKTEDEIKISRHIIDEVAGKGLAVLSTDAMGDKRFAEAASVHDMRIRSVMCVPLMVQDEVLGIIQVDTTRTGDPFTGDDLELLTTIANQVSLAVEQSHTHQQLMRRELVERDLQLARRVQHSFLPSATPEVPGMAFTACYRSALQVGGDFYDFIPQGPNRIAVVVGDVAGKGVHAALLMARMTSDIRFLAMSEPEPKDILAKLNAHMTESQIEGMFVTLLFMTLNTKTLNMTICNAAHPAPIIRRATEGVMVEQDACQNLPLGLDPDMQYEQEEFQLQSGDTVVALTDGIPDAMDASMQVYGWPRLKQVLAKGPSHPDTIIERLMGDLHKHLGDVPQGDDLTVVCFGAL